MRRLAMVPQMVLAKMVGGVVPDRVGVVGVGAIVLDDQGRPVQAVVVQSVGRRGPCPGEMDLTNSRLAHPSHRRHGEIGVQVAEEGLQQHQRARLLLGRHLIEPQA